MIGCIKKGKLFGVGYCSSDLTCVDANGKVSRAYNTWFSMLRRCYYDTYKSKHPSYIGCVVSPTWHDFANFNKFYNTNYYEIPDERVELDKDLLFRGNKVYSPETCRFVPQSINLLLIDRALDRGAFPVGVYFYKQNNKYRSQISIDGKRKHLGYYSTVEEASSVYKSAKEDEIKRKAEQYKHILQSDIYDNLINYKIN